ncbi:olfactory receptor 52E4-like [Microcaecilia unicolor]|uniref:Olfactory receptor n=1 Tax=Microcaecilia unicolor TaxID=1415580 RepID=A0A6P7XY10_9AMPH|nr:olfactory receptor 52E4-like [Microcaecilia unicolor]
MFTLNASNVHPPIFILIGIPGLEAVQCWIAIPLCLMYLIAVFGNCIILFIVKKRSSLHTPMFFFLCMLGVIDLVLSTSTLPKMLSIFWFHSKEILFEGCVVQMYFIHSFTGMESGILLAMAYDRYVAICNPLQYASVLTNTVIVKMGIAVLMRNVIVVLPFVYLTVRLPYCKGNVIAHSYCEHMGIVKLACADTTINNIYGMMVAFSVLGFDITFIAVSYVLILRAVLRLPSKAVRLKAISTCSSHISVMLIFYTPAFFSFLTHRFGHRIAPHVHIIVASVYVLLPPMLNPVIYGVRTKQIRESVLQLVDIKRILGH